MKAVQRILVIEDDLDVADMLHAYFIVQGYDVLSCQWGEDAVLACQAFTPALIILDMNVSDIDGLEVVRLLRAEQTSKDLPIVFLVDKKESQNRIQEIRQKKDLVLNKPIDVQELRSHVRNCLFQAPVDVLINPTTGLPEGELLVRKFSQSITNENLGILVISLLNLDNYQATYGKEAGHETIRAMIMMVNGTIREFGGRNDLLGHLTLSDLVLVTTRDHLKILRQNIERQFERAVDYFYPIRDRDFVIKGKRLDILCREIDPKYGFTVSLDEIRSNLPGNRS